MSSNIFEADLLQALPAVLKNDETTLALAYAIAKELHTLLNQTSMATLYPCIDTLPEEVLDVIAHDFKVDWYDYDYTLEQKRDTIKNSWNVHRKLGTKYAVETAISAVYQNSKVEEWFEYGGKPYFFRLKIDLSQVPPNPEGHARVMQRVGYYKNLRSHIEDVEYIVRAESEETVHMGGCMASIMCLPIMEIADNFRFRDTTRFGGVMATASSMPVPEIRDKPQFNSSINTGGKATNHTFMPVPEIK